MILIDSHGNVYIDTNRLSWECIYRLPAISLGCVTLQPFGNQWFRNETNKKINLKDKLHVHLIHVATGKTWVYHYPTRVFQESINLLSETHAFSTSHFPLYML